MKKGIVWISAVAALLVLLAACENITLAEKYNLPEDPVEMYYYELVDCSAAVASEMSTATLFHFRLSDNRWANYINIKATLDSSNRDPYDYSIKVYSDGEDRIWGSISYGSSYAYTGLYSLKLYAEDSEGVDQKFTVEYPVYKTEGEYEWLGVRNAYEGSDNARSPYIIDQEANYAVAFSDDKSFIFIKPADAYATTVNVSFTLNYNDQIPDSYYGLDNYTKYALFIPAGLLEAGKWLKIPTTDLILVDDTYGSTLANADIGTIRSDWDFISWATTGTVTGNFGEYLTWVNKLSFEGTEPTLDIIERPESRGTFENTSRSREGFSRLMLELTGLADKK